MNIFLIPAARDEAGLQRLRDMGAQALKLDVSDRTSVSDLSWQLDGEKIEVALYVAGVFGTDDAMMHANVLGAMQAMPQVAPWIAGARGGHSRHGGGAQERQITLRLQRCPVYPLGQHRVH